MSDGRNLYAAALTETGARTAARLAAALNARLLLPQRLAAKHPHAETFQTPVAEAIAARWKEAEGFLLVMAAGIATRSIAPLLNTKYTDPAVIVFDPEGRYAVPILSGHIGGANDLARKAALALEGQAVITTATDAAGAPAIEVWAKAAGLALENPEAVAGINRALAENEKIALYIDRGIRPPASTDELLPWLTGTTADAERFSSQSGPKIAITDRHPGPEGSLTLRPKTIAIGVGSKKGADPEKVVGETIAALRSAGWSEKSVALAATIDIKSEEPAILALSQKLGVELKTYPAAELAGIPAPNPSERVKREVGTAGVAEPSAIAASGGGKLILQKISGGDWTLAAARMEEKWAS